MKIKSPAFSASSFTCPHCGVTAEMYWTTVNARLHFADSRYSDTFSSDMIYVAQCRDCEKLSVWVEKQMVYPSIQGVEPHEDMPEDAKKLFNEAQDVIGKSPRSACALLRLCLEVIVDHLGGKGDNLHARIESLKLPPDLYAVFKACRIAGNQAVHPGLISFDNQEGQELAFTLSGFVNLIVAFLISPRIQAQRILATARKP